MSLDRTAPAGLRLVALTALALVAFAANSLLCRVALRDTAIDPVSFTAARLGSGALVLWAVLRLRGAPAATAGSWTSALALWAYAAAFSFAYLSLSAGTGALLLFGAVQATMIGWGWWRGERPGRVQGTGLILAVVGLVLLLLPGLSAPPLLGGALMLTAGVAWGVYSLRAQGAGEPTAVTAGNFWRAACIALALGLVWWPWARADAAGLAWAVCSGALASGLGYAVWYAALRGLAPTTAASVQLAVPVLAALAGVVWLGEALTLRLVVCSVVILGGIGLVIGARRAQR